MLQDKLGTGYFQEASKLAKELIRDFNRKDHDQVKEDLKNMLNKMTTCAATAEQKKLYKKGNKTIK